MHSSKMDGKWHTGRGSLWHAHSASKATHEKIWAGTLISRGRNGAVGWCTQPWSCYAWCSQDPACVVCWLVCVALDIQVLVPGVGDLQLHDKSSWVLQCIHKSCIKWRSNESCKINVDFHPLTSTDLGANCLKKHSDTWWTFLKLIQPEDPSGWSTDLLETLANIIWSLKCNKAAIFSFCNTDRLAHWEM